MTILKRSTDTQTGISVTRNGAKVETFNIMGNKVHEIDSSQAGVLIHRWFAEVTDDEIKEILGGHFVEEFTSHKRSRLLADLSHWDVSWDGVNDWLREELMPRLYAAGLRHLAVIVAPTPESDSNRYAAERFSDENPGVNAPFTSEQAALAWLETQP